VLRTTLLRSTAAWVLSMVLLAVAGVFAPPVFLDRTVLRVAAAGEKNGSLVAYTGARIYTCAGPVIERGVLIVDKGKIVALGPVGEVDIPNNAVIRDVSGKTIIPGLVDTHSHIGIFGRPAVPGNADGNEMTNPVQPGLRAIDAINPDDPSIKMALAGGVTTANIMPGSGNAIGGQTLYVKLRGAVIEAMRILTGLVLGGIKFANGENPIGAYGKKGMAPGTRMKVAALQREQLVKARDYKRRWDAYKKATAAGKKAAPPETDINLQPLVEVLERKRTVHFHCHRADDIMTAVRLSEEFNFELVLQHCTEGYRVADELGQRKMWVSLTLVDSPGGKPEVLGLLEENAAILHKAGVKLAINTDDFITESRFFLRTGAIAVRGGLSEDAALKALTLHGAEMLHLEERCGSLEKGKDADFVVLSGRPFSVYTQVLQTYIEGEKVFDRSQHLDWTYQAGGFALADKKRLPRRTPDAKPQAVVKAPEVPADTPQVNGTPKRLAIYAGRVHTVANGSINDGVILIENGKVAFVGPRDQFKLPPKTPVLSAAVVTPGLIDAHTVMGLSGILNLPKADQDQDEMSDPNQADLRVLDSFNPNEPLLDYIRRQGVTVIHAMPGRANVIGGQTGVFRTYGATAERMALKFPAGILVNLGEIPKGSYAGKLPSTRMGTAGIVRTVFSQAAGHARKRAAADEDKRPPPNLKLEALEPALRGEIPVIFSAHRADDLLTSLRLAREFKLRPILSLATEGYLVAGALADAKAPVIVHPTMQRPATMETLNGCLGNAAALAEHKIPFVIGTAFEGYVPKTRVLRYEAAMAMVNGLGFDRTLKSITLDAAKLLGIDDRYGSIQAGKVADLVLYDGDPFEHTTHVTHTLMDGRVVWDRTEYLRLPFARRVLNAVGSGGADYGCCLGVW
jgi:imidazolonepropionase-like amidohydrolase